MDDTLKISKTQQKISSKTKQEIEYDVDVLDHEDKVIITNF